MLNTYQEIIFGKTFRFKTISDRNQVNAIIKRLNEEMKQVAMSKKMSFEDVLVLASLNIVEQLLDAEIENESLNELLNTADFEIK